MLELTKEPTTPGFVVIKAKVPDHLAARVESLIAEAVRADAEDRTRTPAEAVLGPRDPARHLRGARYRENLTQRELAAKIGAKPQHVSEMERGKRPIGKDMAKRLGEALNVDYRAFL